MARRAKSLKAKATGAKRLEPKRKTSSQRGYTYAWQKARLFYLKQNPLCVECAGKGVVEPAVDVDHIVPHGGDKELFWDRSNWQGLCRSCHSKKTATEDGGFGNPKK